MRKTSVDLIFLFGATCLFVGSIVGPKVTDTFYQRHTPKADLSLVQKLESGLSLNGQKLVIFYQKKNEWKANLVRLREDQKNKEERLGQLEDILQSAKKLTGYLTTGQDMTIGQSSYTFEQIREDIQIRERKVQLLGSQVEQGKNEIAERERYLEIFSELTQATESEVVEDDLASEISKAKLIALCFNPEVNKVIGNFQNVNVLDCLKQAEDIFESQLAQVQEEEDLLGELLEPSFIDWDEPIIANRNWIEQSDRFAKAKVFIDQALAKQVEENYDQALDLIKEALLIDPESHDALKLQEKISQTVLEKERQARQVAYLEKVMDQVRIFREEKEYTEALDLVLLSLLDYPDSQELLNEKDNLVLLITEEEKARQEALQREQEEESRKRANVARLFSKAKSLIQGKDYDQADSAIKDLLKIDPQNQGAIKIKDELAWLIAEENERKAKEQKVAEEKAKQQEEKFKEYMRLGYQAQPGFFDFSNEVMISNYENSLSYYRSALSVAPTESDRIKAQKMITKISERLSSCRESKARSDAWNNRPRRPF